MKLLSPLSASAAALLALTVFGPSVASADVVVPASCSVTCSNGSFGTASAPCECYCDGGQATCRTLAYSVAQVSAVMRLRPIDRTDDLVADLHTELGYGPSIQSLCQGLLSAKFAEQQNNIPAYVASFHQINKALEALTLSQLTTAYDLTIALPVTP